MPTSSIADRPLLVPVGIVTGGAVDVEVVLVTLVELVDPVRPVNGVAASALAGSAKAAIAASTAADARSSCKRSLIAPNISAGGP